MFRQMMKLRTAKRALSDGHPEDALQLADDPEIRDHVKAIELRRDAVMAVRRRAEEREKAGDYARAADDWRFIAKHEPASDAAARVERIDKLRHGRDDTDARVRATYFKARLEVERGDVRGALDVLTCIPDGDRTREISELMRELRERIQSADRLIDEARGLVESKAVEALDRLDRAALLDPKHPGIRVVRFDAMRRRVKAALDVNLTDEVLVGFLIEHGIEKRRNLADILPENFAEIDLVLNREIARRVDAHLANGDIDAMRRLLDRRKDNLAPDARMDQIAVALGRLESAKDAVRRGRFAEAESALVEVKSFFGDSKGIDREIARIRAVIDELPALADSAEQAMRSGDFDRARRRYREVVEKLPNYRDAARALAVVEKKIAEQDALLDRAKEALARGRPEEARDVIFELEAMNCRRPELDRLRDDARNGTGSHPVFSSPKRSEKAVHRPASAVDLAVSDKVEPTTESAGVSTAPVGATWILTIEEGGEYVVIENDIVVIGNATKRAADLLILAALASRHARIVRTFSFHAGVRYAIEAIDGHPVFVNEKAVTQAVLEDGVRVRLGRDFSFTFHLPSRRSRAAKLELARGFDVEGSTHVMLMPASGRSGAIVIGDAPDAHIASGGRGECEFYRERSAAAASLFCQAPEGVTVDAQPVRPKVSIGDRNMLSVGDLRMSIRAVTTAS